MRIGMQLVMPPVQKASHSFYELAVLVAGQLCARAGVQKT